MAGWKAASHFPWPTLLAAAALAFAATAPAQAAEVKTIDLGKQAQVWFVEDHTVPIVSFDISLPAGSAYDPAAKPGLATFAASHPVPPGTGGQGDPLLGPHRPRLHRHRHHRAVGGRRRGDAAAAIGADPAALRQ
jgi:hypothetical protein